MARDPSKSKGQGGPKTGTWAMRAVSRGRRSALERQRRAEDGILDRFLKNPNLGWAAVITASFVALCGVLAAWARTQPIIAPGRIANETVIARVPFELRDPAATDQRRMLERQQTPRVYIANLAAFESIRASIENLPRLLATVERLDQLAPEVSKQFQLTDAGLAAIRAEAGPTPGEVGPAWKQRVSGLVERLKVRPILDDRTAQREELEGVSPLVQLRVDQEQPRTVRRVEALVNLKNESELAAAMNSVARAAGFTEPVLSVVVSRLTTNPEATFAFDEALTVAAQNARAEAVQPIVATVPAGQVIYREGERVEPKHIDQFVAEARAFAATADRSKVWIRWASVIAAVAAIALAMAGYLALFSTKVRRNPLRMFAVAALCAAGLAASVLGTIASPGLIMLTAIAPTVFAAVIIVIAYDRRVALAMGTLLGVLVCIALDQGIGTFALILTGISFAVITLREIRDRSTLVRMGLSAGAALAVGTALFAFIDRPITDDSINQTLRDAVIAGAGGLATGVVALAVLPIIERWFGITTGMTLIELRDPKQPLLRELQQRAPGTYNHSLNVASIAEAAADSIKADSLLTYVGALYHDVGKMNKPDYFVENQMGATSRHEKLSPAMSLLVIVGHVKDGLALAEEYALPRTLRHFVEAHHGTTLVEFFYNRARKQAEGSTEADIPEETEYRYPGPKPRTKEVAILMLADAVESATRTMPEPTPSRIEALVRAMASKRLMDGQFDECELTLRELNTIVESISRSVAAIYHGRVVYQSTASLTQSGSLATEKRA